LDPHLAAPARRQGKAIQLLSLLIVAVCAIFFVATKLRADPAKPPGPARIGLGFHRAPGGAPPPSPSAAPGGIPSAKPPGAAPDSSAGAAPGHPPLAHIQERSHTAEEGIDYAELGPQGGVPTHPQGEFRSPFAHPKFGEPCLIKTGLTLTSVRNYDIKQGTFEADFFLSLTSSRPMPELDLVFTNGKEENKVIIANKPTFKLFHLMGTFYGKPDLHDYPFDTQRLTIELEDDDNGIDQVRFVPDQQHTGLDSDFHMNSWEVAYLEAKSEPHWFPARFEHDDLYYSQYKFSLGIARHSTSAAFTVFVPAIVIVLIGLFGVWLPREELDVRANAGAPMLAAAVLFHFTLTQELPATAYFTRADKVMLAVYFSLLLNMLATWFWFIFDDRHSDRIFRISRLVVPPLTLLAMLVGGLL
jgi:hypothetical protein